MPRNRDLGYALAMATVDWPLPQPTSPTVIPFSSLAIKPGTAPSQSRLRKFTYPGRKKRSIAGGISSPISEYGIPPPFLNASMIFGTFNSDGAVKWNPPPTNIGLSSFDSTNACSDDIEYF